MFIYPTQRERTERNDPEAGIYRAKLNEVYTYNNKAGKLCVRFKWELLSHPNKNHLWLGTQFLGISNPGLLAKAIYDWKKIRWGEFCEMGVHKNPSPQIFIDDEADVAVLAPPQEGQVPANIGKLFPPGELVTEENGNYTINKSHPFIEEYYPEI
jgi:hypothetical protein